MAETTTTNAIETKKVTDLEEKTTPADADLFMAGDSGTASLKKFKWSSLIAAIKTKLAAWTFDTLTTTNKTLPGALNELNSNLNDLDQLLKQRNSGFFNIGDTGLKIAWGNVTVDEIKAGGYTAGTGTFATEFSSTPMVFASIEGGVPQLTASVFGRTKTGCTLWIANPTNAVVTNRIATYLAIGY